MFTSLWTANGTLNRENQIKDAKRVEMECQASRDQTPTSTSVAVTVRSPLPYRQTLIESPKVENSVQGRN